MNDGAETSLGMRRRSARIAAVQALYQLELSGGSPETVIGEFTRDRMGGVEARGIPAAIDPALFADIVRGVIEGQEKLDRFVADALDKSRVVDRLEVVMRAILRAGAYELSERADIDAILTINEYVAVAKTFFNEREPALVNAVLDRIMQQVGNGESAAEPVHGAAQDG
jgi:N utilization substance protein B